MGGVAEDVSVGMAHACWLYYPHTISQLPQVLTDSDSSDSDSEGLPSSESDREDSVLRSMFLFPNSTQKGEPKLHESMSADTASSRPEKVCKLVGMQETLASRFGESESPCKMIVSVSIASWTSEASPSCRVVTP